METWQIVLLIVGGSLAALFAIWLFLIAPALSNKCAKPFMRPYAHRGLWGQGVPENSLTAFRKAAEAGFGIELDLQLSSDGEVFVFHDYDLNRMCGEDLTLTDLTAAQLKTMRLGGTDEEIPTFREVLAVVAGRVPLLIEFKGESSDVSLCPKAMEILDEYEGAWCMESFNPYIVRWFKKNRPDVVRGLLSTNLLREKKRGTVPINFVLTALLVTFLCRPHFHAWAMKYPYRVGLRFSLWLFRVPSLVFTVQNETDYRLFSAREIYPIFDGFVPSETT